MYRTLLMAEGHTLWGLGKEPHPFSNLHVCPTHGYVPGLQNGVPHNEVNVAMIHLSRHVPSPAMTWNCLDKRQELSRVVNRI